MCREVGRLHIRAALSFSPCVCGERRSSDERQNGGRPVWDDPRFGMGQDCHQS
jgi:hypothetical protein